MHRASRRPEPEAADAAEADAGEKTYLPQILGGLAVTGKHILGRRCSASEAITVQYPEEQHVPEPNYRGVHRLNKDEQGRVKCVACMLCATACPAHCIDIVGATAPDTWPDREKYCESFVIDELRCIYCGMCEEACPVEAIELTGLYDLTGLSREQMIFDKTKLLSVFDLTKDAEPMKYTHAPGPAPGRRPRSSRPVRRPARSSDRRPSRATPTPEDDRARGHARPRDLITVARGRRPRGDRDLPAPAAPPRPGQAGAAPTSSARPGDGCRAWRSSRCSGRRPAPRSSTGCSSTPSRSRRSAGAILTITSRDPVHSALWFAAVVLATSGLFLLSGAPVPRGGDDHRLRRGDHRHVPVRDHARPEEGRAIYDRMARSPFRATLDQLPAPLRPALRRSWRVRGRRRRRRRGPARGRLVPATRSWLGGHRADSSGRDRAESRGSSPQALAGDRDAARAGSGRAGARQRTSRAWAGRSTPTTWSPSSWPAPCSSSP